jgi:hypothetical protein
MCISGDPCAKARPSVPAGTFMDARQQENGSKMFQPEHSGRILSGTVEPKMCRALAKMEKQAFKMFRLKRSLDILSEVLSPNCIILILTTCEIK